MGEVKGVGSGSTVTVGPTCEPEEVDQKTSPKPSSSPQPELYSKDKYEEYKPRPESYLFQEAGDTIYGQQAGPVIRQRTGLAAVGGAVCSEAASEISPVRVAIVGSAAASIGNDVVEWSKTSKKRGESNPIIEGPMGIKPEEKLTPQQKAEKASAAFAKRSGFKSGNWCGYFVSWALDRGAAAQGLRFKHASHLASAQKARGFFVYSGYTKGLQEKTRPIAKEHREAGQTRRYFVFEGSEGHRWARKHAANIEKEGGIMPEVYSANGPFPPLQAGDVLIMRGTDEHGEPMDPPAKDPSHIAMIKDYDPDTGILSLVEGNNMRNHRTLNLNDTNDRALIEGFGRLSPLDYEPIAGS